MKKILILLFTLIAAPALAEKTVTFSCTVPPLQVTLFSDKSAKATYKDFTDNDKAQEYSSLVTYYAGTGSCSYRWWLFNYQGTPYQVSELGCNPSTYNVPIDAVGELRVNGSIKKHLGGQYHMEDGVMFWCRK